VHFREELPWGHDPERQPGSPIHPASEVRHVTRHEVGGVGDDSCREEWPIFRRQLRRRQPLDVGRRRLSDDTNRGKTPPQGGQRRRMFRLEVPLGLDNRKGRSQERDAAGLSQLDQERREPVRAVRGGEQNIGVEEETEVSHDREGGARPPSGSSAGGAPLVHSG
jgi:hypothetical protein